jgi:hypothetical protein
VALAEIPIPPILADRRELTDHVARRVRGHGVTFITGGSRLPHALVGRHISVVDERGVVVFKVPLYSP